MTEEQAAQIEVPANITDIAQMWEHLPAGLKARAMRSVYDDQQKIVVELQRLVMEKGGEIAVSVARARAAEELKQDERKTQIIETELVPKRKELDELQQRVAQNRELLDAFSTIGKGII